MDILKMLDHLDSIDRGDSGIRPPFPYPGGKTRSLKYILDQLPYRDIYVEPFCGSFAVGLARPMSKLEVANDLNEGIIGFYKCLQDKVMLDRLCDMIELSITSRTLFKEYQERVITEKDPVLKAFLWYYCSKYSFGGIGRNVGRCIRPGSFSGKLRKSIPQIIEVHNRLSDVYIEQRDALLCMKEYDSEDTVFYLDPPYLDTDTHVYKDRSWFTESTHVDLLELIFSLKGFVALSGYDNDFTNTFPWNNKLKWKSFVSIQSVSESEANHKENLNGQSERAHGEECLWIKE